MENSIGDRLRVAVVGAGTMARLHVHALSRVSTGHKIVGVADLSSGAAAGLAAFARTKAFTDLDRMLAETRPDIVHVCTPAGRHVAPARAALEAGAHVYVEKPFVETRAEADSLLRMAAERSRLVCAGHQLVRQPAFAQGLARAAGLGRISLVDSTFQFKPPTLRMHSARPSELAAQLLDILPHPLYTLVAAVDGLRSGSAPIALESATATPWEIHAHLRSGDVSGRLFVSLRARPVASGVDLVGERGALHVDLMRGTVNGAGNDGTAPLEKMANPIFESARTQWGTVTSLARRFASGGHYPGLVELISEFYEAARAGGTSPLTPDHLLTVTDLYERLATRVRESVPAPPPVAPASGPVVLVTGARGFFGQAISRALADRGYRVRGVGRGTRPEVPFIHEWVRADLSRGLPATALADVGVVVHAAAETAGGFEAHQRNSVDATERLIESMDAADVRRLILISSISVLAVPRSPWEVQDEATPLTDDRRDLGAYTWGKAQAELVAQRRATELRIATRVIRPGALVDHAAPVLPGLMGRRLFGRWHLGMGRPGLPFGSYDVHQAGALVAWFVASFDEAPTVLNLNDPALPSRRRLLQRFREHGWDGRMFWMPISLVTTLLTVARTALAWLKLQRPTPLSPWGVLRPRRYDMRRTADVQRRMEAEHRGETTDEAMHRSAMADQLHG